MLIAAFPKRTRWTTEFPSDDELVRPKSPARSDGHEGQDLDEDGEKSSPRSIRSSLERSVSTDDLEKVNSSAQDINSEERSSANDSSSSRDIFEDSLNQRVKESKKLFRKRNTISFIKSCR